MTPESDLGVELLAILPWNDLDAESVWMPNRMTDRRHSLIMLITNDG